MAEQNPRNANQQHLIKGQEAILEKNETIGPPVVTSGRARRR